MRKPIGETVRHNVVKLLAPTLYKGFLLNESKAVRPFTLMLKNLNRKNLVGLEIGVSYGDNAKTILENLDIKKLFLVDPYIPYIEENKKVNTEAHKEAAINILWKYNRKTLWFFMDSTEASKLFEKDSLDFVYIDGNHNYECVLADIRNYYPLIKKGGYIGGHDFLGEYFGVIKAVTQFANEKRLGLVTSFIDWWLKVE